MKKVITDEVTNVPAGTVLGLDHRQSTDRLHLLEPVAAAEGLEEGFSAYRTTHKTGFKRGEVLFVEDGLPKTIIKSLIDVDAELGAESGDESGADPETDSGKSTDSTADDLPEDLNDMKVKDIKAALKAREIDFKGVKKKDDLLDLLEEALDKEESESE